MIKVYRVAVIFLLFLGIAWSHPGDVDTAGGILACLVCGLGIAFGIAAD
jgi:hypothetical protein